MKRKVFYTLLTLTFFIVQNTLYAQTPPTIQICSGGQEVCIDSPSFEICVTINVEADFTAPIDHFEITWGDDLPSTIVPGSSAPPNQMHIYDLSDFFGTCAYVNTGFAVRLDTYLADGSIVNSAFFPTFKNPPIAIINNNQNIICVGDELCMGDNSCPAENLEVLSWDFGDGTTPSMDNCHTYTEAGTFFVELTVKNDCGIDTDRDTIIVRDPPIADVSFAEVGTGSIDTSSCSPYHIIFDNSNSANGAPYHWEITLDGVVVLDSLAFSNTDLEFTFNSAGTYVVTMTTNSVCENVNWSQLFTIKEGPAVSIVSQNPTCETSLYTPNVIYSGGDIDSYEWVFEGGNPMMSTDANPADVEFNTIGPHPVTLTVTSACGTQTAVDTFFTLNQEVAQISIGDTTICSLDGQLTFSATPDGGEWRIDGVLFDGTMDPETLDAGTYEISYGLEPCISIDRINLTIVKADITMPADQEVCLDDPPVTFMASPSGGTWSGNGVTSGGVFDPAALGVGVFTLYYETVNAELPSCSNIDSFQVSVAQLYVDFEVTSCEGNTLCFDTLNTSGFTTISWDFDGLGISGQLAPCFTFPSAQSYNVTATIRKGNCEASITKTVAIEPPPIADFNLNYDNSACSPLSVEIVNNSSPDAGLIYEWLLNGTLFSTEENPDPQLLEAITQDTTFEFKLTVSNDCSSDSQTTTVLVHPQPVAVFGTDQNQYCSGDTISLANVSYGNVDNYEWFLNGDLISTDSIEPIISYITAVTDTIEVCLATANACSMDTLCRNIEIVPTNVNAFFNTSPTDVCAGDTVWLTNFATSNVPVFYDFGDGNTTSNPNPFHIYQNVGIYTINQQAFGCGFDQFEKEIEVHQPPLASWNNPAFGCPYSMLFFENTSMDVMRYEWDFGDGSPFSEEESPGHSYANPGVYEVCLTVFSTEAFGCTHTLCKMVEIYTPPTAGFTYTDSLCLGDVVEITSTASGVGLMCDYQFGDDNLSDLCAPSHQYQAPGIYVMTQVVTDQNLCKDTLSQQVFVRDLPQPDFDFQLMNGCHPDSVLFNNLSQNADNYQWDFGDGTTADLLSPVHYYVHPGIFTVTLTASVDGICTAQLSKDITIDETPLAVLASDVDNSCAGSSVQFTNLSSGTFTDVIWDFGDDTFSYEDAPNHIFELAGSYTIELIVRNEGFCADTTQVNFEVFEAMDVTFETTDLTCFEDPTGGINSQVIAGTAPYEYTWSNGANTESIDQLQAGAYNVVIQDAKGCRFSEDFVITQPTPLAALITEDQVVSCFGGTDGYLTINAQGGLPDYTYLWDNGSAINHIDNVPAGDYMVTITDANACVASFLFTVNQNPEITVVDHIVDISCFGYDDGEIFIDSIMGGVPIYNLTLQGPVNYESIDRHFGALLPGNYELNIKDENDCVVTFDYTIGEPDSIFVNIIEQDTVFIKLGEEVDLLTDYNAFEPVFVWTPDRELSCDDCFDPVATPFDDVTYEVVMTNSNGCVASDHLIIEVAHDKEVFFATAFTPNDDGFNDVFRIRSNAKSIVKIKEFAIYDRWGELQFEANDFDLNDKVGEWDGRTPSGRELSPAVFTYYAVIQFIDGESVFRGDVTLIK